MTGSIASGPKVFETATKVTSKGLRPASRHAEAISPRNLASACAGSAIGSPDGVISAARPWRLGSRRMQIEAQIARILVKCPSRPSRLSVRQNDGGMGCDAGSGKEARQKGYGIKT